jgi:hypothetical protein
MHASRRIALPVHARLSQPTPLRKMCNHFGHSRFKTSRVVVCT